MAWLNLKRKRCRKSSSTMQFLMPMPLSMDSAGEQPGFCPTVRKWDISMFVKPYSEARSFQSSLSLRTEARSRVTRAFNWCTNIFKAKSPNLLFYPSISDELKLLGFPHHSLKCVHFGKSCHNKPLWITFENKTFPPRCHSPNVAL